VAFSGRGNVATFLVRQCSIATVGDHKT